eukprot:CAMPEP_0185856048 /NCGR_PEP_ID=MMETSP1354-20130828/27683_1 /TAXON_ID=708628 /ORGANISM="Erythrolobus madagascarensis, Strain CCMP3276" /LENGTH=59 /DNA_ID=CAMNT_0028558203 /DNA_START=38 /DNA_END=214 /DNA_ORIENTATION=-
MTGSPQFCYAAAGVPRPPPRDRTEHGRSKTEIRVWIGFPGALYVTSALSTPVCLPKIEL